MIRRLKSLIFQLQLKLERNIKLYLLVLIFAYLILFAGYFLDSNSFFSQSLRSMLDFFILLLLLILFVSNYLHVRTIKTQRSYLAVRKRLLQKYVNDEELNYQVSHRSELHEIYENGSGFYKREIRIQLTHGTVHRYDVTLSSTNSIAMDQPAFSFKAYLNPGKHQLDNFVIKLDDRDRIHAVPFLEPLTKRNSSAFLQIEVDWPSIWTDFTKKGTDTGVFKIAHKTDRFTMELISPKSMRFTKFSVNPQIGTFNLLTTNDVPSKIFFSVDNPPLGNYEYYLMGEKRPSPFFRLLSPESRTENDSNKQAANHPKH